MAAQNPLNYPMGTLHLDETWQKRWRDTVSYATSSASQENGSAERNAQREREQRNRTARFQNPDSNPMQPLFKEPIKVDNSEDEISRRIQSTLGDFQSVKHFIQSENLIGISSNPNLMGMYSSISHNNLHNRHSSSGHRNPSYGHKSVASSRDWKHQKAPDHPKESPRLPAPSQGHIATSAPAPPLEEPPLTNGLAPSKSTAAAALPNDVPSGKDPIENILQEMKVVVPPLISEIPSPEKKEPSKEIFSFNDQDQLLDQLDLLLDEPADSSVFPQPLLLEAPKSDKILGEDLQVSDSDDDLQQPQPLSRPPRELTPPPILAPPPLAPIKQEELEEELPPKPQCSSSDSSSGDSDESSSGSDSDEEPVPPSKPAPQGWNLANFLDHASPPPAAVETSVPPPPTSNKRKRATSPPPPAAEALPRTKRTKLLPTAKRGVSPAPVVEPPPPPPPPPVPEHGAIWVTIDLQLLDSLPVALQGKVSGWKPYCLMPNISVEERGGGPKNHKADSRKKHSSQRPSSPWPRPCDYLVEAPRANKHQEVMDGPQQVLSYFDAIHQFIKKGASMETGENVEHDKLYALYKDTLTLLRFVDFKFLREEPVPLSVLSYKCQAYLHYKLYLLRRGAIDELISKATELQKVQQFRLPLATSSPALPRSPHSPTPSPAGSVGSQSSGYSSSELSRQSVPDIYYTYIVRINHFMQHVHQATGFWEHAQGTFEALSPSDKDLMREVGLHPQDLSNFPLRELVGYMSTLLSRLRARLQASS